MAMARKPTLFIRENQVSFVGQARRRPILVDRQAVRLPCNGSAFQCYSFSETIGAGGKPLFRLQQAR